MSSNLRTLLLDIREYVSGDRDWSTYVAGIKRTGLLKQIDAALEGSSIETPADYVLPCEVRLPPSTTIGIGCTLTTLMSAIRRREGRDEFATKFTDATALAIEQALQSVGSPEKTGAES